MMSITNHKRWIYSLLVLLTLGGGLFLRTCNLGKFGFFHDELYHVIAARSIIEKGRPAFPNGQEYMRALPYTKILALSFRLFGESETTARMPSVIINIMFLLIGFWIVKKWSNSRCALAFLVVMSFSPFVLNRVRMYRMYAFFQLFYFLGSVLFFYGMEWSNPERKNKTARLFKGFEEKHDVNVLLIVLSAICFLISLQFHLLTINFGFVLITYLSIMWLLSIYDSGFKRIPLNKYSVGLIIILCSFLLFLLFRIETFLGLLRSINHVPIWARYFERGGIFYARFLYQNYPVFFFLYPLGLLYSMSLSRRQGTFLLCSFVPLFLLHSYVFQLKDRNYIFYIFPFFIMGVLPIIDHLLTSGWNFFRDRIDFKNAFLRASFTIAFLCALGSVLYPWFPEARRVLTKYPFEDWKAFHAITKKLIDPNAFIISNHQNHFYYYFGRKPDYCIQKSYFEEEDDTEHWMGASPITNVDELKEVFKQNMNLFLITKNLDFINKNYIDDSMRLFILENTIEIPLESTLKLRLFKRKNMAHTDNGGLNGSRSEW